MTDGTLYQITARFRAQPFGPASLGDFTTDGGTPVASTTVLDPCWSLYDLDLHGGLALFVWLAPDTDLSSATFVSQTQFEAATMALTIPLDAFVSLSQGLARPANLILLFSIGRCGTTLANHILNTAPQTRALSEPRAFVTLALARNSLPAERAAALITAATLFALRPLQGTLPHNMAIKFHSQVLFQADLYHRAFPQARFVFMYRDAKGWANSFSGFLQNIGLGRSVGADDLRFHWTMLSAAAPLADLATMLDVAADQTSHAQLFAAGWAYSIACFRRLSQSGVPFFALHYADLTNDRETSVRALLSYCDLADSTLTTALATFDRDSQAGTAIGRGGNVTAMDHDDYAKVVSTLARFPDPISGDIRL